MKLGLVSNASIVVVTAIVVIDVAVVVVVIDVAVVVIDVVVVVVSGSNIDVVLFVAFVFALESLF